MADLIHTDSDARAERTRRLLARERRTTSDKLADEYTRLHAILCLAHHWDCNDSIAYSSLVDLVAVAERLDEIRGIWRRESETRLDNEAETKRSL